MQGHWVVKQTFQPGLVPMIMAKASKRSPSSSGKEGIHWPASGSTLLSKMMTLRTSVVTSCPRTPRLTRSSVCNFSRAGGKPETCTFQATKCLWTYCWRTITLCLQSGFASSAQKHASSTVSRIHPRLCSSIWWESSGIFGNRNRTRSTYWRTRSP